MIDKLPPEFKKYFWDVDFNLLDWRAAPEFVLKRIIDTGGLEAWHWVRQRYPIDRVRKLVISSRDLSRRTANFWAMVFNLKPEEVPCLRKPYSPMPWEL